MTYTKLCNEPKQPKMSQNGPEKTQTDPKRAKMTQNETQTYPK